MKEGTCRRKIPVWIPLQLFDPVGEPSSQGIFQGDKLLGWIPREDVAAVLVESIFKDGAKNKTFEALMMSFRWVHEFDSLEPNQFGDCAANYQLDKG